MNWLFYALLSPALYTIVNFTDKYIIEREIPDYRGMPIFTALTGFLTGTIVWVVGGTPLLNMQDSGLILFTGMLTVWGAVLYFTAVPDEAASNLIVLFQMTPVMVLIMSLIFLQESLMPEQLLGFALILAAAVGVSFKRGGGNFHLSR